MSDEPTFLYLVRRRPEWELMPSWFGVWQYRAPKNGGAVRAFASRDRAEAFRLRREERTRAKLPKANPFRLCRGHGVDCDAVTSLPEFAFLDWVRDTGLVPPTPPEFRPGRLVYSDWFWWWKKGVRAMTPEQLAHMWRGLDRVQFYEIATLEMG